MRSKYLMVLLGVGALAFTAVAVFGSSLNSTVLVTAEPSIASTGIMGHLEIKATDSQGNLISYQQTDNVVVQTGIECIANDLFASADDTLCSTHNAFDFVAIGNEPGACAKDGTETTLTSEVTPADRQQDAGPAGGDASNANPPTATVTLSTSHTVAAGTSVDHTGVFDAATAGNLLATQCFNEVTAGTEPITLDLTWNFNIG